MMMKKLHFFILGFLLLMSGLTGQAATSDPYLMEKDEQQFFNVEFEDSFFTIKMKVGTGEIIGFSHIAHPTKKMTDQQFIQMLLDGVELLYGKDSEAYTLNKIKFMTLLNNKTFHRANFETYQLKTIQPRYELHKEKDRFMNVTFNHSAFAIAIRAHDGEITGTSLPQPQPGMTDEKLAQMIIDCAELIYGKDTPRYNLNKDKYLTLLKDGDMNYYD